MSKYCPICLGEYQDKIMRCPKHDINLVTKKPEDSERFIDIYAATDELEALRIMSLLEEEGIEAHKYLSGVSQFPALSSSAYVVAVINKKINEAKSIIEHAREDNIISKAGVFL
jgi:hypothetical protein